MKASHNSAVAVLLHLAHHEMWSEIKQYLSNITEGMDLYVNLVRGINTADVIEKQALLIKKDYPESIILSSPNIGMDIGGTFFLIREIVKLGRMYPCILKIHTKTDVEWRKRMFDDLLGSQQSVSEIIRLFKSNQSLGMVGSYFFPFDYFNVKFVAEYLDRIGISYNRSWEQYRKKYPETVGYSLEEVIRHCAAHANNKERPLIDLEYYEEKIAKVDEPRQVTKLQLQQMRSDGILVGPPYYPGTCFWIGGSLMCSLFNGLSLDNVISELESGAVKDDVFQTRTHAWERLFTIIAICKGFKLAAIHNRQKVL